MPSPLENRSLHLCKCNATDRVWRRRLVVGDREHTQVPMQHHRHGISASFRHLLFIYSLLSYFDRKRRAPPTSVKELFGPPPPFAKEYCYDYGFINLNIYDLAEKYEQFSCIELKEVLHYFKVDQDKGELVNALTEGILKGRLSRDAALVCAIFLGLKIRLDNNDEEIDMCKAIRDFKKECIREGKILGRLEGREEGQRIGEENALRTFIKNLLDNSFSFLDICKLTGASEEKVEEITLSLQQS